MLRYNNFILERTLTSTEYYSQNEILNEEEAIARIKEQNLEFEIPIFKGGHFVHNFLLTDPKNYTRKTHDTFNYYTLILDNAPDWKDFPKRSKSLICSLNKKTAILLG